MAAGRGDGIDLDSPQRWVVEGLRDPVSLFQHLDQLIPGDSILYFEVTNPASEVTQFYEAHPARSGAVCVVRDMIFPVPEVFHVQMQPGMIEGLISLLGRYSQETCFTHVKAYRGDSYFWHSTTPLKERQCLWLIGFLPNESRLFAPEPVRRVTASRT